MDARTDHRTRGFLLIFMSEQLRQQWLYICTDIYAVLMEGRGMTNEGKAEGGGGGGTTVATSPLMDPKR